MTSRRDFIKGLTAALVAASVPAAVAESVAEKTVALDNLWHNYQIHVAGGKIKKIIIDCIDDDNQSTIQASILPEVKGNDEAWISYWAKVDPDYKHTFLDDLRVEGDFKSIELFGLQLTTEKKT